MEKALKNLILTVEKNTKDLIAFDGAHEIDKAIDKARATLKGIRCKHCGALLMKGKCPVNKKDCGR
jgi:DNA-directed RNA polymerase subunit RPC12/RpoP